MIILKQGRRALNEGAFIVIDLGKTLAYFARQIHPIRLIPGADEADTPV